MAGLYIHIPFCQRKCIYCDFYSVEGTVLIQKFLDALELEILNTVPSNKTETFHTIYIGGGTPSLLTPDQVTKIFKLTSKLFTISSNSEITIEINPGTVTLDTLKAYRQLGINRLSIGIQSLHNDELKFLGRIHNVQQAEDALRLSREAGFQNISVDLIQSLPMHTTARVHETLERICAFRPEHISAYSLIVEDGTPLAEMVRRGEVLPLQQDNDAENYEYVAGFLQREGYVQYEVSNFALPGFYSRHNHNYWNHTPYLGFGPSAHSFKGNIRWWNVRDVNEYCRRLLDGKSPEEKEEQLSLEQLLEERIFLGLRSSGIDIDILRNDYGFIMTDKIQKELDSWRVNNLTVSDGNLIRLTTKGYAICDELTGRMISLLAK